MDFVRGDVVKYIGADDSSGIDYGVLLVVTGDIFNQDGEVMEYVVCTTDGYHSKVPSNCLEIINKEMHDRTLRTNELVARLDELLVTHNIVMSNITTTVGHDRIESVIDGKSKISLIPDGSVSYDIKLTFVARGD